MAVSTVPSFVGRTRQCLNDRWAGFPCATCPTVAQKLDIPVARASPHSVTARVSAVFAWPRFYSSVSGNRGSLPGELFATCLPQLRVRNSGPPIRGTACRASLRCRPGNVFAFLLRFRFASSFLRGELYLARVQPSNNILSAKPDIFADFDMRQALGSAPTRALVDPRRRHVEQVGYLVNCEKNVGLPRRISRRVKCCETVFLCCGNPHLSSNQLIKLAAHPAGRGPRARKSTSSRRPWDHAPPGGR